MNSVKRIAGCAIKLALSLLVVQTVTEQSAMAVPETKSQTSSSKQVLEELKVAFKNRVTEPDLARLEKLINDNPNNAEAHALLGQCLDKLGMRELAGEQYIIANKLDPERSLGVLEKFHAQFRDGDPADCFDDWVEIRKKYASDPIVEQYEEAIARGFGSVAAAEEANLSEISHGHNLQSVDAILSMNASHKKDYHRALKLANFELKKHLNDSGLLAKSMALNGLQKFGAAQVMSGAAFNRNLLFSGAAREHAISCLGNSDPDAALVPAFINLCVWTDTESKQKARLIAVTALKKASPAAIDKSFQDRKIVFIQGSDRAPTFNAQLGQAFVEAGMPQQAVKVFAKAAKEDHLSTEGYVSYAQLLESQGSKEAVEMYKQAAYEDHMNPDYLAAADRVERKVLNRQNDIAGRIKDYIRGR